MALPQKPVSLQGTAPTIFTGERSLSETFMRDFKIYKIMNPLADVMKQPYARVATALSLIRGPKVDDWVDEQLKELEQKVRTTPRSDETLWTDFEVAFTTTFTDTAKKEDAYQKLKHLKMKDELVDDYITAFNSLAAKAGWELSNAGTIDAFRSGLRPGTLNAIMNRDTWPDTMPQWQQAARDEMRKYLAKKSHPLFSPTNGESRKLGYKEPVAASLWTTRTRRRFLLSRPKCNGRRCRQHQEPPQRRRKETTHGRRTVFLLQTTRTHVQKLSKETQSIQCPEPPALTKRAPSPSSPHRTS
jgi:Retrotransposon gag protein